MLLRDTISLITVRCSIFGVLSLSLAPVYLSAEGESEYERVSEILVLDLLVFNSAPG